MKVLHKTLKKRWFDMIESGEKKEEYLEIKPYWINRFFHLENAENFEVFTSWLMDWDSRKNPFKNLYECVWYFDIKQKHFDIVSANNGYQKNCPNVTWQHLGIRIGEGKPEWGAEPGKNYFILSVGGIISTTNTRTAQITAEGEETAKKITAKAQENGK